MEKLRKDSSLHWALVACGLVFGPAARAAIWIENWEPANVRAYPASTTIRGSAGKWLMVDDTAGCSTNRNRAEIVRSDDGKLLRLSTTDFGKCTLPRLTATLQHPPRLTLQPDTMLSLVLTGFVAMPSSSNGARIQMQVRDQNGHELVYVFRSRNQPARTDIVALPLGGERYQSNGYHEIFLANADGPGGEYLRPIQDDFRQVPLVGTNPMVITNISFSLQGVGQASLDNVRLGTGLQPVPPRIVVEPDDRLAPTGGVGRLQVDAIGTLPLTYQWQKGASPIPGAELATLTMSPMTLTNADRYRVIVSNGGGAVTSRWARLSIVPVPILHLAPNDVTVTVGETAHLEAFATAVVGPVSYQWKRAGTNLAGAQEPILRLSQVTAGDAGLYTVRVSDGVGSAESPPALVSVINPVEALRIFELANGISVEWPTRRGTNYQLDYSFDLERWWPQASVVGTGNLLVHEYWMPEKLAWHNPVVKEGNTSADWVGVTYGNGIYLAHDGNGAVAVSENGHHWRRTGAILSSYPVVFGNGTFVTWQEDATHTAFLSSVDGVFWTKRTQPGFIQALGFGDGVFFALGLGVTMESTDGLSWTSRASKLPKAKIDTILFAQGLLLVGFAHSHQPGQAYVSTDRGATWTWRPTPYRFTKTIFARNLFVGVGMIATNDNLAGVILTSTNGYDWKTQNTGTLPALYDLGYWDDRFAAVGREGTILLSSDATNWVRHSSGDSEHTLYSVVGHRTPIVVAGRPSLLRVADIPPYFRVREGMPWETNVISMARRTGTMTLPRELSLTSDGQLTLRSIPWKSYQLESSADLVAWTPLGEPLPGTGDNLFWPRDLVTAGEGNYRVRVTDQLRRLADIYFGRFTNLDNFIRDRGYVNDREEKRLDQKGYRATGDYLPPEEVEAWLARLTQDDLEAWLYDGVVKGSLGRLTNDLVPYWKQEKIKAVDYPEWNMWVSAGASEHAYHLKTEGRTHRYLLDHQRYHQTGERGESVDLTRIRVVEMYLNASYRVARTQDWMEESLKIYGLGKDWVNFTTNTIRAPEGFSQIINTTTGVRPTIVRQSSSGEIVAATATVLFGEAVGTEPITYQWRREGVVIAGATNRQLVLDSIELRQAGRYTLRAMNPAGEAESRPITLTVLARSVPPHFSKDPQDQWSPMNGSVVFEIGVDGRGPFNYDWYLNGQRLAGRSGSELKIDRVQAGDIGSYYVVVTDPGGAVTSAVARLNLILPPSILQSPESQLAARGADASLKVAVNGTEPFTYQWFGPLGPLPSATQASLTWDAVELAATGDYFVVVGNAAGTVTSAVARLTVLEAVRITAQPRSREVGLGAASVLSVTASGDPPLSYQWFHNNSAVPGGTSEDLWRPAAEVANSGNYYVRIQNAVSATTSTVAALTVILPPTITRQPAGTNVAAGRKTSFSVQAGGTLPLNFQWWHNEVPILGATNDHLWLERAQPDQRGRYWVTVSNSVGAVASLPGVLEVVPERRLPTLTVLEPRPKSRLQGNLVRVHGKATDDTGLARVEYRLGSVPFTPAIGTTNWSVQIEVEAGPQLLTVRSLDTSGNYSRSAEVPFTVVDTALLTIDLQGAGRITPPLGGTLLEIAKTYRLSARPAPGHLFAGWRGGLENPSADLSFVMRSNLTLEATFVPNPFLERKGIYAGLIQTVTAEGPPRPCGFIKVALTKRGTFSATLHLANLRHSLAGALEPNGRGAYQILLPAGELLKVELELGPAEDELSGSVMIDTWKATMTARRNPFEEQLRPAPQAGSYVLVFSDASAPSEWAGDAFGTITVSSAGGVGFRGSWADGTALRQEAFLNADGQWTLHADFANGAGLLVGTIQLMPDSASLKGSVSWLHSAQTNPDWPGFEINLSVEGERLPSADGPRLGPGRAEVTWGGGNMPSPVSVHVLLDAQDQVTADQSEWRLTVNLTGRRGEMRGSFVDPLSSRVVLFQGVQLPRRGWAAGYWRHQNESGYVRLQMSEDRD